MDLMRHLPWQAYHDEEHVADFQQAVEQELIRLCAARDDLYKQLRPSTSTWGITEYEKEYAIQPNTSKNKELRLSAWRARRRGRGTTTEELIRSVAESYSNGPVDVTVYPRKYIFELVLPDSGGMPAYLEDLMAVIWEIRPAHLGMAYRIPINTPTTIYTAGNSHMRMRGNMPIRFPKPKGNTESKVCVTAAEHLRIRREAPLASPRRAVPASTLRAACSCHLHIQQQLGGAINACKYN